MKRGFTLAEALVATTLLCLMLSTLAILVRSYSGSSRASDVHDASLTGARLAVESVRRDGEAAVKLLEPLLGSNTASAILRVQRIDPEIVRLPETMPDPAPGLWDPYDPNEMVEVRYYLSNETLWREVFLGDGTQKKSPLGEHVQAFLVTSLPDNTLQITCSTLNIQGQLRPVTGRVTLRCLDLRP